ncbi:MFS transporter [Cellulomonas sp. NPDC089187]|uniref:MFS transporter n=1 Tax=Cellulomonas sp. NPDC089187 TaxID=3154970 RepID=UPI00343506AE
MPTVTADVTAPVQPLGRRFTALLGSTAAANLADGIVQAAAPLYALTLTRSPGQIGLLTAAAWLPWLLLGTHAGLLVDRTDRRQVQAYALLARVVMLTAAAGLAVTGSLTMTALVVLLLAYGVTDVLVDLAESALVPDLVPRSRLAAANGRIVAAQQVAGSFIGAPLAGLLLAVGAGWVFGTPALIAGIAVVVLAVGVRGRYRATSDAGTGAPPDDPPGGPGPGSTPRHRITRDLREGLSVLFGHPVLRPLLVAGSVSNMCFTAYTTMLVLWVVGPGSRVALSAELYPLLTTVMAVGALAGSVVVEPVVRQFGEVRTMLTGWVAMPLLLLVPVIAPHPVAIAGALGLIGIASTGSNVLSQSLRQRLVPRRLLGRVGGASRAIGFGLMPVGALLGGAVAERAGVGTALTAAALVALLALSYPLVTVRQRMVNDPDKPDDPADPQPSRS